jgi:preprotein translocase subunit SecE
MALQAERLKSQAMSGEVPESRGRELWDRLMQHPKRWGEFLHEVRVELRQVTWPTRHEVVVTTFVVIVAVAFFGVFFFGVDSSVGWILNRVFNIFKH